MDDVNSRGMDIDDGHIYREQVLKLLEDKKNALDLSEEELIKLQISIENLSMEFDENNIFKESSNIIKILIGKDLICAKDYLYQKLPKTLYDSTIMQFGQYTLEAIIIYVLGMLYNCIQESSVVRVATLIDKLDSTVRTQANILKNHKIDSSKDCDIKQKKGNQYEIGMKLFELMIERKLIHIDTMAGEGQKAVVKKIGKGYLEYKLFAVCNFELRHLPMKLNLPMVCQPKDWELLSHDYNKPLMLSDMRGGYLCKPTLDIYNRFSILTSRNLNHFNIELHEYKYKEMCFILNGLQKQGFEINKSMLEFIVRNRATLEKVGILMPRILACVNLNETNDHLRKSYFDNKDIKEVCSLSFLLTELAKRVQAARFEESIIRLATAYVHYVFYLPAFMDFRGRIYRSGILHFHERDLAKSIIVFANNQHQDESNLGGAKDIIESAAAFKYKKFSLYDDALQWYKEKQSLIYASDESLISFAKDASDPFQFIAKVLCHNRAYEYNSNPIKMPLRVLIRS